MSYKMQFTRPSEQEIRRVMADIGVDYMQAYYHVVQRAQIKQQNKIPIITIPTSQRTCYNTKNVNDI